jgi:hypothetical protein
MSRSKDTRGDRETSIALAKRRMDDTRRTERQAHERALKTGNPDHRRDYIRLSGVAQQAQDDYEKASRPIRDTGWRLLRTPHGPRFHREIGRSLQLDVEPQISTWIACAVENRSMVKDGIRIGLRTQQEAARAIEQRMGVAEMPLPSLAEKVVRP